MGNVLVHLDRDRAKAQSYLSVVHRTQRGGRARDEHVRARYLDRLVRHGGDWLFAERTLVFDWSWSTDADLNKWWGTLGSDALEGSRTCDPSAGFGFLGDAS
jgi:hypothetical protein